MASGQKRKPEDELSRATAQPPEEEDTARGSDANADAVTNPTTTATRAQNADNMTEEQRRLEDRRAYNRANSARARLRSKQQIASLQATVDNQNARLQELEKSNTELTEAVSRLNVEKQRLQQTIQILALGEMGANPSIGGGGVPLGPLDTANLLQGGAGLLAPRFPMQQLGHEAVSSSSLQQGTNSMRLLASLGGFRDNHGRGLAAVAAGPSAAMPASPYLGAIQRLGDSSLRPYIGSLAGAQSQPDDSQRAAVLSSLFGNTSTTTTQSAGWSSIDPAILHQLQTLGPLHQTEEAAALELLLSRQQHQGGKSNDASESSKKKPTR